MKKQSFLIISALLISVLAFGQQKQDTAKKAPMPGFKLDTAKVYTVTLSGNIDKINAVQFALANGYSLIDETDLPAATRKKAKANVKATLEAIKNQLDVLVASDRKKFSADSLSALKKH